MNIILKKLNEIKPYEKNPRKNDFAVDKVVESIKTYGFKVPIILDKNGVIVAGHTRFKASQKLNLEEVPCIIADDLTDEQIKAYRIADNRVAEYSEWDMDLLKDELDNLLDFTGFKSLDTESISNDETFKPVYTPQFENNMVTNDKIEKTSDSLSNQISNYSEQKITTISCPHCGEEIHVKL
jgi:hypothetical protein